MNRTITLGLSSLAISLFAALAPSQAEAAYFTYWEIQQSATQVAPGDSVTISYGLQTDVSAPNRTIIMTLLLGTTAITTQTVTGVNFDPNVRRYQAFNYTFASNVGSSRVDLQACKLEYSIVSPK